MLAKVFFPSSASEDLGVMESFAVFGGAFLMRPVGGIIIGYIGDVSGRKRALEISIFLMAIATTCMGTYVSRTYVCLATICVFGSIYP